MTLPSPLVGLGQAVAVEAIITGILVLVVFAVAGDPRNSPSVKGSAPLAIGKHPFSILSPKLVFSLSFLATLVALHFTPVSKSVSQ